MTAPIHRLAAIGSTMDLAHRYGEEGAPAGTVVVAAEQSAGRGSRGRAWHSGPGGLWLSVLLRPSARSAELLSLRAGLAVAGALERATPALRIAVKWPNDLLVESRKLGGVLCEVRWVADRPAWAVIGVGLNVANRVPAELGATRLADYHPSVTVEDTLDCVLPALRALDVSAGRLGSAESQELARRDWLRGRVLEAPLAGTAEGITGDGALLLRTPDGRLLETRSGPVALADPPGPP